MWALLGLIPGLLNSLSAYFQTKANADLQKYTTGVQADTQVILAQVNAQIELNKLATQQAIVDKGWWVTAWMKPVVFYPCALHFGAVILDSMTLFGHKVGSWGIVALPSPMDQWQATIILAAIGLTGLKGVARIFSGK